MAAGGGALLCALCAVGACCALRRRRRRKHAALARSVDLEPSEVQVRVSATRGHRPQPPTMAPPTSFAKAGRQGGREAGAGALPASVPAPPPPPAETPLPPGWERLYAEEGNPYYHNYESGETAWEPPETRL